MGNARFCPEYAISQFDESKHDYKEPCGHRDWRKKEHHDAARVENAKASNTPKTPPDAPMVGYIPACLVAVTAAN